MRYQCFPIMYNLNRKFKNGTTSVKYRIMSLDLPLAGHSLGILVVQTRAQCL